MHGDRELGRFGTLLVSVIGMMLILSWASETGRTGPFLGIATAVVLLGGTYAVSGRRTHVVFGLAVAIPALATNLAWELFEWRWLITARLALTALFLSLAVGFVLDAVRRRKRVDADTVLGGVCVYFLLVIAFMYFHGLIEHLSPSSYRLAGSSLENVATGSGAFVQFFYFSMVTITTLGYGDMVPTGGVARLLCGVEAIFGQLFVAIFIARLVSLYTVREEPETSSPAGTMS
jgi:hypothetical protein